MVYGVFIIRNKSMTINCASAMLNTDEFISEMVLFQTHRLVLYMSPNASLFRLGAMHRMLELCQQDSSLVQKPWFSLSVPVATITNTATTTTTTTSATPLTLASLRNF